MLTFPFSGFFRNFFVQLKEMGYTPGNSGPFPDFHEKLQGPLFAWTAASDEDIMQTEIKFAAYDGHPIILLLNASKIMNLGNATLESIYGGKVLDMSTIFSKQTLALMYQIVMLSFSTGKVPTRSQGFPVCL